MREETTKSASESKRVVFTFDKESYDALRSMTDQAGFKSMAETVRESLRIARALQRQSNAGFTELTMRNPDTQRERTLVIPLLERLKELREAYP